MKLEPGMSRMRLWLEHVAIAATNALLVGGGPGAATLLLVGTAVGHALHRHHGV